MQNYENTCFCKFEKTFFLFSAFCDYYSFIIFHDQSLMTIFSELEQFCKEILFDWFEVECWTVDQWD